MADSRLIVGTRLLWHPSRAKRARWRNGATNLTNIDLDADPHVPPLVRRASSRREIDLDSPVGRKNEVAPRDGVSRRLRLSLGC